MTPRGRWPDRATLELLVGALAIGWAAIFFRLAGDTDPLLASAIRLALAAAALSPVVLASARRGALTPRVLRAALLAGVLYAIHFGAWVASLAYTSVAASVTLVTATPMLLAVIALVQRRDAPSATQGRALALTTLGVAIIGGADLGAGEHALFGDGLALLGAAAMALYLLVARSLGPSLPPVAFMGVASGVGAALLLVASLALCPAGAPLAWPPREALVWIALSALVPQLLGHTLLTRALVHASPTVVGLATCAEPVVATLLAIPLLGETPSATILLGCTITLIGVLHGTRSGARAEPSP